MLVTTGQVKDWAGPAGNAISFDTDEDLARCIDAATAAVERAHDRVYAQAAASAYFDGSTPGGGSRADGWAAGRQNIQVAWTGGYEAEEIPADLVQLVCELSFRLFQEGPQAGKSSAALMGQSEAFMKDLSPQGRMSFQALRSLIRPVGVGGVFLYLPTWPVVAAPLPTVTEDGNSLTVAVGYNRSADVILYAEDGKLWRQRQDPLRGWIS